VRCRTGMHIGRGMRREEFSDDASGLENLPVR
jgi:hypothetical protein